MWIRLIASFGLMLGSLGGGWALGRRGLLSEAQASRLVRVVVKVFTPPVVCISFWGRDLRAVELWILPLLGVVVSASALLPAWLYARRARLDRPQTGSMLTCALFSNLGYFGAFAAFALYGEQAYALCLLYFMFFTPMFYGVGFSLAARYGGHGPATGFGGVFKDDLRLYPFAGMALGAALSLGGVPRPAWLELVNHVMIPLDTALSLTAIGSQLVFTSPRPWMKPCLAMSAIKFLYTPLIAWLLLNLFHIEGLARQVVLIEASAPVGVSPLVLPLLFGLDRRLSNSLWLVTTALAIPWFLLLLPLLQRL